MGSATIDVVPYNGALAVVGLLTPDQTILLGDFGPTESGVLTDVDGTLGPADDGIATFSGQPITYIGSGTATPGVAVPLVGIVATGDPVDMVAFEAGGQVYFHYPDGPPDLTSAVAVVISLDTSPYPIFTPVCFDAATLLSTPDGERRADSIRPGDEVLDIHGNAHRVLWTAHRHVDLARCGPMARRRLAPVVIAPGALSDAAPSRTLRLSQNHLILIRHPFCAYYHGADALLVPAGALIGTLAKVDTTRPTTTYVHLLCATHVILRANGQEAETLLPGPQAIAAMPPLHRRQLMESDRLRDLADTMVAAAPVLSMRDAKFLASEIAENRREKIAC